MGKISSGRAYCSRRCRHDLVAATVLVLEAPLEPPRAKLPVGLRLPLRGSWRHPPGRRRKHLCRFSTVLTAACVVGVIDGLLLGRSMEGAGGRLFKRLRAETRPRSLRGRATGPGAPNEVQQWAVICGEESTVSVPCWSRRVVFLIWLFGALFESSDNFPVFLHVQLAARNHFGSNVETFAFLIRNDHR